MTILLAIQQKRRRLYILKLLADSPAYTLNSLEIQELLAHLRQQVSHRELIKDLKFLENNVLIITTPLDSGLSATITQDGIDVSRGVLVIDGIARPSPESQTALEILDSTLKGDS